MKRNLRQLADGLFDLLVVGGGSHGLAIAYDAAERGLRVALVDRNDFGSGLSFNHQRTIHGGLRSLQTMDLARARESIRERRALARIAPHVLKPLPFLMGTYRGLMRGRLALRAAFRFDALLAVDRNHDVVPELHLPTGRLVSRVVCTRLFPGIREDGLTGGAMWYDYQAVEPHRLTLAFALAAHAHGAVLANYVEAREALRDNGAVTGMRVRDVLGGEVFDIKARLTLNATGSFAGRLMAAFGVTTRFPLLRTMNVVTTRPAAELAFAASAGDGRMLTLVPWHGRALVGTSQSADVTDTPDARVTTEELDRFLRGANQAFPALRIDAGDVVLVQWGLVPAAMARGGRPALLSRAAVRDHAADGAPGAFTVVGVKYTTARGVAERAVDRVMKKLGRPVGGCRTQAQPLPGAGMADVEALAVEAMRRAHLQLDEDIVGALARVYGTRCPDVLALAIDRPDLAERVGVGCPVIKAEIVHAVREEMAVALSDAVLRRTALAHTGDPGDEVAAACAGVMARELGWTTDRIARERDALRAAFRLPFDAALTETQA